MSKKKQTKQKAPKARTQKIVVTKKVSADEGQRLIEARMERFTAAIDAKMGEVIKKHNDLSNQIDELQKVQQQIATFAASEFGKVLAQQQTITTSFGQSIDHLDVNLLALVEVTKEVFGQLAQVDHILQNAKVEVLAEGGHKLNVDVVTDEDIGVVKQKATEWHTSVVQSAFRTVLEQRQEEETARTQAALEAQKQAERAATDQSEAERVDKELREAESANLVAQVSGGRGADIPEGADVFGG